MLRVRVLGLAVPFAGLADLEIVFVCFSVMSFNLAVKKKEVFDGTALPKTSLFAQTPLFL